MCHEIWHQTGIEYADPTNLSTVYARVTAEGSISDSINANKLHVKLYVTIINMQAIACIVNQSM